jgi:hypothetical protein
MQLVHYSAAPVGVLQVIPQRDEFFKPAGFWLSDDDCEPNWRSWCEAEDFHPHALTHVHDVVLKSNANVLYVKTAAGIDDLSKTYKNAEWRDWLNWEELRKDYDGLIISPYIWERRHYPLWYYAWDCASGCIWEPRAIDRITLRAVVPLKRVRVA